MTSPPPVPDALANHHTYADVRFLGRGGMGVVYLAKNRLLDRLEVLKVLNSTYATDERVRSRFLREVQIAAKLQHPHIAAVYSAFPLGDTLVMAMEYVPGEDLAALVRRTGPLSVQKACAYVYQAALGLQHAHDRGLVHRDIKPGNILSTDQDGKKLVKIIDFGLAKAGPGKLTNDHLTKTGAGLGTPAFMAPEQARDARNVDSRADLYSLGATLYFLLAGRPPIIGDNEYDHVIRLVTEEPEPIQSLRPDIPSEVADMIPKLLQKKPEARFQKSVEVGTILLPFARKQVVKAPPKTRSIHPSSPYMSQIPVGEEPPNPEPDTQLLDLDRDWAEFEKQVNTRGGDLSQFFKKPGPSHAKTWVQLAERGDPRGMFLFARSLELGGCVEDAIKFYHQAAEYGNPYAIEQLTRNYACSLQAVIRWQGKAAELKNVHAMLFLGECLFTGVGVQKDEKAAIEWYRKAAELGNEVAIRNLIRFLPSGRGFWKRVDPEAARWQAKLDEIQKAKKP